LLWRPIEAAAYAAGTLQATQWKSGSRPPDVEAPLPLRFGAMPVVSRFLLAEVAAERGVPGPPGSLWAKAIGPDNTNAVVTAIVVSLMSNFL
jgi:hypothetical protein